MNHFTEKENYTYFPTVNTLVEYMETTEPYDSNRKRNSKERGDRDYYGSSTFENAIELCKFGDSELYDEIKEQLVEVDEVKNVVNLIKSKYELSRVGFVPHVPNAIMGIPNNMLNVTKVKIQHKIINVFISISAHCGISHDDIRHNAAKCAAVVNLLEMEGYRCNVYSGFFATRFGKEVGYITKIKSDNQPLNLSIMSFPMASPSMLRRFGLKYMETTPIDFTHDGYGAPMDDEIKIKKIFKNFLNIERLHVFSVSENSGNIKSIASKFKL